jgi:hypothetical protein
MNRRLAVPTAAFSFIPLALGKSRPAHGAGNAAEGLCECAHRPWHEKFASLYVENEYVQHQTLATSAPSLGGTGGGRGLFREAHCGVFVVTDFKAADTNNDGKLTQTEFMSACDKGLVTASAASGSGGRAWPAARPLHRRSKTFKIDALDAPLVCLSYFGAVANHAHVRYLVRRLKRLMPHAKFLAGYWMLRENPDMGEEWRTAVGAHFVATSLADAVAICVREAHGADRELAPRRSNQHDCHPASPVSWPM